MSDTPNTGYHIKRITNQEMYRSIVTAIIVCAASLCIGALLGLLLGFGANIVCVCYLQAALINLPGAMDIILAPSGRMYSFVDGLGLIIRFTPLMMVSV
jgi:hypothetical protein